MQIFPSSVRDLWTTWELPLMALLGLFLQIILILMGHTRKNTSNTYLKWLLWLAYLSTESTAIISLGILSNSSGHSLHPKYVIRAFWTPLFLLHLGGADTISAYSVQDNDMWLRHFLAFLIQLTFSFYIFLLALQPTSVNFIALPLFLAGIIKYGERILVSRAVSLRFLRDQDNPKPDVFGKPLEMIESSRLNDIQILHVAYTLFNTNKLVFVDLILRFQDLRQSLCYFVDFDFTTSFKVVELELGFMHDFLYTKASLIHSNRGTLFRLITLSSIVIAVIAFTTRNMDMYPSTDVHLTFVLLFGALGVEIYSVFLLLRSDWCVVRLSKFDNFLARYTLKAIHWCGWSLQKRRWSNSVPQHNLITHCLEDLKRTKHKFLRISSYIKDIKTISQPISDELKERIFKQLNEMVDYEDDSNEVPDWIKKRHMFYDHLGWSMELDSCRGILIWHIATEVCYHFDHKNRTLNSSSPLKDTKLLSCYLMYLLWHRHSLFSNGVNRVIVDITVTDIRNLLEPYVDQLSERDGGAYKCILDYFEWLPNLRGIGEWGIKEALRYGVFLAHELLGMEEHERWEIISHEWVDILAYVACECKNYDHIEQLGHGGDFLTHVWLFMHHIGYTKRAYDATTARDEVECKKFRKFLKRHIVRARLRDGNATIKVF